MVLNHLAAIFFFSGPLFYIGLLLMLDPGGIASLPEVSGRALRDLKRLWKGLPLQMRSVECEQSHPSSQTRGLRVAGAALVACGVLFALVA